MQMKGLFRQPLELRELYFRLAPEAVDPVDVDADPREFALRMIDVAKAARIDLNDAEAARLHRQ